MFEPFSVERTALVLEGGGMRGMFTCGVLDALMDCGVSLGAVFGVSAGALFGMNYVSHQPYRALRYNLRFRHEPRYMGLLPLLTTGHIVGTRFAYERIPRELDPVDFYAFRTGAAGLWVVATNIRTGEPVYRLLRDLSTDDMRWLRASASMPVVSRPVHIHYEAYLDGGLSDSIPLRAAQERGAERAIVVLTQPASYFKTPSRLTPLMRLFHPTYPRVAELIAHRHEMYNAQLRYIAQEEKAGRALLIYPSAPLDIGRTELSAPKMLRCHKMGYEAAMGRMKEIEAYLARPTE